MKHINNIDILKNRPVFTDLKLQNILPFAALLAAVFLWGTSFASMSFALNSLSPMAVMWSRMVVALICLIPISVKLFPKNYQKGDIKILIPMVLFQPCFYFLLESNALRFTSSSQAGIISACVPLMVTALAWLVLKESITGKTIMGIGCSITGVVCLTLFESPGGSAINPAAGNLLEVLARASAAAGIILVKQLSCRYSPLTLTAMQVTAGTIFFLPGLKGLIIMDTSLWTMKLIGILIFLGAFITLGAFGLYNWGLSKIPASRASAFINLVPVTAILTGWLALEEVLNLFQIFSACAVILGVMISSHGHNSPSESLS